MLQTLFGYNVFNFILGILFSFFGYVVNKPDYECHPHNERCL